jgi:hypothetical protein
MAVLGTTYTAMLVQGGRRIYKDANVIHDTIEASCTTSDKPEPETRIFRNARIFWGDYMIREMDKCKAPFGLVVPSENCVQTPFLDPDTGTICDILLIDGKTPGPR